MKKEIEDRDMKKEMKSMKKQQSYAVVPVMIIAASLAILMMKAQPVINSMPVA